MLAVGFKVWCMNRKTFGTAEMGNKGHPCWLPIAQLEWQLMQFSSYLNGTLPYAHIVNVTTPLAAQTKNACKLFSYQKTTVNRTTFFQLGSDFVNVFHSLKNAVKLEC